MVKEEEKMEEIMLIWSILLIVNVSNMFFVSEFRGFFGFFIKY